MKRNNRQLKNNYAVVSKVKMGYQLNPPPTEPAQHFWMTRVVSAKPTNQPGHHKYTGRCAKPKGCVGYKEKAGKGTQKSRSFYVGGGLSFAGSSATEVLGRLCNGSSATEVLGRLCNEYQDNGDDYWDDDEEECGSGFREEEEEEEQVMDYWDDSGVVGSRDVRSIVCEVEDENEDPRDVVIRSIVFGDEEDGSVEDEEDDNGDPRDVVQSIAQEFMSNWDKNKRARTKKSGFGGSPERLETFLVDDVEGVDDGVGFFANGMLRDSYKVEEEGVGGNKGIGVEIVNEVVDEESEVGESDEEEVEESDEEEEEEEDDDAMSFCDVGFVVEQVDGDEEWCMVEEM